MYLIYTYITTLVLFKTVLCYTETSFSWMFYVTTETHKCERKSSSKVIGPSKRSSSKVTGHLSKRKKLHLSTLNFLLEKVVILNTFWNYSITFRVTYIVFDPVPESILPDEVLHDVEFIFPTNRCPRWTLVIQKCFPPRTHENENIYWNL